MRSSKLFVIVLCLALGVGLLGCTQIKQAAIERSREYATVEGQVEYLVSEANNLIRMEKFVTAIDIGKYILKELDSDSVKAQEIIKTARAGLKESARYESEYNWYDYGLRSYSFRRYCD